MLLFGTSRGARLLLAACTRAQRWLLGLGALAVAGYPVTFYPAVARTGVAMATVIALGSAPVFAGLLAWATGQGRPGRRWATAAAAAVLGCAALVLRSGASAEGRAIRSEAGFARTVPWPAHSASSVRDWRHGLWPGVRPG
jgi:DME family drug/metabolite transporter